MFIEIVKKQAKHILSTQKTASSSNSNGDTFEISSIFFYNPLKYHCQSNIGCTFRRFQLSNDFPLQSHYLCNKHGKNSLSSKLFGKPYPVHLDLSHKRISTETILFRYR